MKKLVLINIIIVLIGIGFSCKSVKDTSTIDTREKDFAFNSEFLEANKQKQIGEYEKALEHYTRALRIEPDNATVMYEIAGIAAILGDIPTGIKYAKMSVEKEPENIFFNIMLARLYQRNGMLKEAADAYSPVIKIQDTKIEIYFEQASLYLAVGEYKQAIKTLDKAEKQLGVNEYISLEKERIYRSIENYDRAKKELKNLIEAFPQNSRYSAMLAESYLADGNIEEAGKVYEKMLEKEVNDGYVHISVADYYRIIEDYDKTFKHLEIAFASYDVELDMKVQMLANILMVIGDDEYLNNNVYNLLDVLMDTYPNEPKVLTLYSDYLVKDGKWEEAQKAFNKILNMDKSKYLLWEQALYIDGQLNDFETMFKRSNEAKELFPFQPMLYLFNSVAALQQENYNQVVVSATKGIELSRDNKELNVELLTFLADAYYKLNMFQESDSAFEKVLEIDAENTFVINNYSYYLALRNENIDRALELGELLIKLAPNTSNYLDTYAWILYKADKYEEALEIIEKSINKGGNNNPTIVEHYGDILYKNNDMENAKLQWEKALNLGSDSEELKDKVKTGSLKE
ncbi:MAG TPA: tetratricopeptide repeat protein [Bacteroidales bacterium]|nr:tetratricopeptide repeat protein [Bacteroidales bacterium]